MEIIVTLMRTNLLSPLFNVGIKCDVVVAVVVVVVVAVVVVVVVNA